MLELDKTKGWEYDMELRNNEYKPISFWSWNSDIKEEEIRIQIQDFKEKGFGGFFIHSRAGLLTPYLSDAWFEACAVAIDEAKRNGLYVWLYDEDGWPSGFAGGLVNGCGEDYCAKQLRFCNGAPTDELTRVLAVYRKTSENNYKRIAESEGTESDLYCFYRIVPHYVDIMDNRVIAEFIRVTHEKYKEKFSQYFGTIIKGIFTDEPQMPDSPCWSLCMEAKYKEFYDEDILDDLWLMHVEGIGYRKLRYRFWRCANELMRENFVCQLQDWCSVNKLVLTGHFAYEDGLCDQAQANGGVMSLYRNMGLPGIDHLGNRLASPVLMKQVSSVAHRRGLPYVLSESFGCGGWDFSFKEMLGVAGWQAVLGVNLVCTHLSAYTITGRRKRDYPAFFSYQEPWWKHIGVLFEAIRRLNDTVGKSARDTNVAVLHPIRSIWCESAEHQPYSMKFLSAQFRELVENLLDIHVDFDLLDESELENANVEHQKIKVGEVSYSLLIIPEATTVAADTVKIMMDYAKCGGKILFINGRPNSIEGDSSHPLLENVYTLDALELQNTRHVLQKYFRTEPVQHDYRLFDARMENEVSGLTSHYGKVEDGAVLFLFNRMSGHNIHTILQHKGHCRIQVVNLTDGQMLDVCTTYQKEKTFATLNVESGAGILVKITYDKSADVSQRLSEQLQSLGVELVEPLEENCLTLDMGRFRINNGSFSKCKAILHMLDEIYGEISGMQQDSQVTIEYRFYADFKETPAQLSIAVEKTEGMEIELNGLPVRRELDWWVDKGIVKYDISDMVIQGENIIGVHYQIPKTRTVNDTKEKFESERNRFFYKIEPESIYICGRFDVKCNTEVTDNITYKKIAHTSTTPTFTLVDTTDKCMGDITSQNMWFYRGDCAYTGKLHYDGCGEVIVCVPDRQCICVEVCVNGTSVGLLLNNSDELKITQYLSRGENVITVVAVGHNRNLMGPHHHVRGAVYFVGPHTFAGVHEWEDFVNPDVQQESTWIDDYTFVPFGINQIVIKRQEGQEK